MMPYFMNALSLLCKVFSFLINKFVASRICQEYGYKKQHFLYIIY